MHKEKKEKDAEKNTDQVLMWCYLPFLLNLKIKFLVIEKLTFTHD